MREMSVQRVCDLDGTIIDPASDLFFTVVDSRTGKGKDICAYCAQTKQLVSWYPSVGATSGVKIKPTTGIGKYVFVVAVPGVTGDTEPNWPTSNGHAGDLIVDGGVTWMVFPAPNENATVRVAMPGTTSFKTSIFGWMSESNEPVS